MPTDGVEASLQHADIQQGLVSLLPEGAHLQGDAVLLGLVTQRFLHLWVIARFSTWLWSQLNGTPICKADRIRGENRC